MRVTHVLTSHVSVLRLLNKGRHWVLVVRSGSILSQIRVYLTNTQGALAGQCGMSLMSAHRPASNEPEPECRS